MTQPFASTDAAQNQLWPIPKVMHQNLDQWVSYTVDLEHRLESARAAATRMELSLTEKIGALRAEMVAIEQPLLQQIAAQEQTMLTLRLDNEALRKELDAATELLATVLEVAGKRPPLQTLINDTVVLVEEAKKQIRETL